MTPTINNHMYDELANSWWDENGMLHLLKVMVNPWRVPYFAQALRGHFGADLSRIRLLDIGCGGGVLAEEFAHLGCQVTGIDVAAESIAVARAHARTQGLLIDYQSGSAIMSKYVKNLIAEDLAVRLASLPVPVTAGGITFLQRSYVCHECKNSASPELRVETFIGFARGDRRVLLSEDFSPYRHIAWPVRRNVSATIDDVEKLFRRKSASVALLNLCKIGRRRFPQPFSKWAISFAVDAMTACAIGFILHLANVFGPLRM